MAEAKTKKVIGPIWGWLLFTILGFIVYQFIGAVADMVIMSFKPDYQIGPLCVTASLIFFFIYIAANKLGFNGLFNLQNTGKAFLMASVPLAVIAVIGFLEATEITVTKEAFWISAMAGVCEEVTYRIIPIAHMMRCYSDKKKLWIPLALTAFAFSSIHLINALAGASLSVTLLQVYGCLGYGVLLGAIYMRTGCSLVLILFHFINDILAFMDTEAVEAGGIMTDKALATGDMISIILFSTLQIILGIWLIRKTKREEIMALWSKIWHKEKTENE